jgi:ribose transport system permease protein
MDQTPTTAAPDAPGSGTTPNGEPANAAQATGVSMGVWRKRVLAVAPIVVLIALILGVSSMAPRFLTVGSMRVLGEEASVILLLALGQTLVILMGGIDLSNAALASLATVLLAIWLPLWGVGAVLAVLGLCAVAGGVQGYIHTKAQIPSFIVTLGGMGLWSGLALTISGASTIVVREGYEVVGWMTGRIYGIPTSVVLAGLVLLVVGLAVRNLPTGRRVYAIGVAEPVSLLSGIRVARVKTAVFAFSGFCAGLTALLLVSRLKSAGPTAADALLLPGIAAVVVGGTAITGGLGGVGRTAIGALILTVLRVGMNLMGVDAAYQQIVYGVLIVVAVAATIDRSKLNIVK